MKTRGRTVCLIVAAILLVLAVIPTWLWLRIRSDFVEQTAAERWRGRNPARFAQVTAFLDESVELKPIQEYEIRQSLETELAGESEEAWILALSGFCTVTVSDDKEQVIVRGICTAGSYDQFHPIRMVSGAWYDPRDINQDGVVLDMQLAWRLFGGYDLKGFSLRVNGIPVQIVGVVRLPEAGIEQKIYGDTPTIWFSTGLMERLGLEVPITCVEAVLPDPVSHFAENKLKKSLNVSEGYSDMVENTGRFGLLPSLRAYLHPDERVIRTSRVTYPYWENAARVAESRCGFYAVLSILLLLFPVCYAIFCIFKGMRALRNTGKTLWKKLIR